MQPITPYLFIGLQSWIYSILTIGYIATIISAIIVVLSENRNPIKSLAWVTVLIFLPVVGLVFYLFFGRNPKSHHRLSRHNKLRLLHSMPDNASSADRQHCLTPDNLQIVKLCDTIGSLPLTIGNEIDIFTSGDAKFAALKADLLAAKRFICLQYYIFTDDTIGIEIADILIQKAREGVAVSVSYDHVGSFSVRTRFFTRMRRAGIDARPFLRVTFPSLANRINWRNHRKIVVIDGEIGYIGGMNIADRYVKATKHQQPWRDTHFRLRGGAVNSLLLSFMTDWSYMGRPINNLEFTKQPVVHNNVAVQMVTSGPDGKWPNIAMAYQRAIACAKRSIYIQTPYFLPTDALLQALQSAALAKVDVRIMIPRHCDSWLLSLASYSYITECLRGGIKIYLYEGRMIHSKTMIIDNTCVTAGSTNFDFRSFEHNFEANIFVYDADFNRRMRDIFFTDLANCTKLTYARWSKRPLPQRALESILRLMSPIL